MGPPLRDWADFVIVVRSGCDKFGQKYKYDILSGDCDGICMKVRGLKGFSEELK